MNVTNIKVELNLTNLSENYISSLSNINLKIEKQNHDADNFVLTDFLTQNNKFNLYDDVYVLLSCDDNYYDFWPFVKQRWESFGFTPVLYYITNRNIAKSDNVIIVRPIESLPIPYQSTMARLYYTKNYPNSYCFISDMDIMPISRAYHFNIMLDNLNNSNILCFCSDFSPEEPECFGKRYSIGRGVVAKGKIFSDVLSTDTTYKTFMMKAFRNDNRYMEADELYFAKCINQSNYEIIAINRGNKHLFNVNDNPYFICTKGIDKDYWFYDCKKVIDEYYIDCHMLRPYKKHKKELNALFKLLNLDVIESNNEEIKPVPINKHIEKILVVVAHPDDESLWCGGIIKENPQINWEIICLTNGDNQIRTNEFIDSCNKLRVDYNIYNFPDTSEKLIKYQHLIIEILKSYSSDLILTHNNIGEYGHDHHSDINYIVNKIDKPKFYFGYGLNLKDTNIYKIKINSDFKNDLLSIYRSQNEVINYFKHDVIEYETFYSYNSLDFLNCFKIGESCDRKSINNIIHM